MIQDVWPPDLPVIFPAWNVRENPDLLLPARR